MNWKKLVETKNAKTFVLPEGWDSRDSIAEQLECSPEKVRDHLRPAIQAKEVLEQRFNVWDPALKRCVMVTAYKQAGAAAPAATSEFDLARAQALKKEGKSYAQIGSAMGCSGDQVRGRMRRTG